MLFLTEPSIVIPKEKFRNSTNVRYLKGLFYEMVLKDKSSVLYTLKDNDHEGYPSLYRLYMETGDLTEWNFAQWYLDGWEHWTMLCNCTWFSPLVERWRNELEIKYRSHSLVNVIKDAQTNSKTSLSSNKLLLDGGWKSKDEQKTTKGNTVGRPSKDKIKREASKLIKEEDLITEDWKRLVN